MKILLHSNKNKYFYNLMVSEEVVERTAIIGFSRTLEEVLKRYNASYYTVKGPNLEFESEEDMLAFMLKYS